MGLGGNTPWLRRTQSEDSKASLFHIFVSLLATSGRLLERPTLFDNRQYHFNISPQLHVYMHLAGRINRFIQLFRLFL
jgi:hypothetical protein